MFTFLNALRGVALATLLGLTACAWAAPMAADLLHSPAGASPLVSRSVLAGITRAGARLVACGERGHILYSDNGGASWTQSAVPVRVTITALRFADKQRGWAVGHGGVILRSDDGGASWSRQADGVALLKALAGHPDGVADERRRRLIADGADKPLLDLYVGDREHVIVVGAYGLMFATADGGATWLPALNRLGAAEERHLYALHKSGSTLYLAGEQGLLYKSADDGATFAPLAAPLKGSIFALAGDANEIVLAGLRGAAHVSVDGGASWKKVELPGKNSLTAARLSADGQAYLLADDGGSVWRVARAGLGAQRLAMAAIFPFSGLELADDGAVVVVGALGVSGVAR